MVVYLILYAIVLTYMLTKWLILFVKRNIDPQMKQNFE